MVIVPVVATSVSYTHLAAALLKMIIELAADELLEDDVIQIQLEDVYKRQPRMCQ